MPVAGLTFPYSLHNVCLLHTLQHNFTHADKAREETQTHLQHKPKRSSNFWFVLYVYESF